MPRLERHMTLNECLLSIVRRVLWNALIGPVADARLQKLKEELHSVVGDRIKQSELAFGQLTAVVAPDA